MKAPFLFIIILLSTSFLVKAQEGEKVKAFKNLDYEIKLDLGMSHVHNYNADLADMKGLFSPSLMTGFSTNLSKNLSLQGGLSLQTYRMFSKDYTMTFGADIDIISGIDQYASWIDYRVQTALLGIPLSVTYKKPDTKSYPYVSARVKTLLTLGLEFSNATVNESGLDGQEVVGFPDFFSHPIMFNPSAVFGYSWAANEEFNLLFEGFFEYCPSRIGETTWPRQSYMFYNYGVSVGVRF